MCGGEHTLAWMTLLRGWRSIYMLERRCNALKAHVHVAQISACERSMCVDACIVLDAYAATGKLAIEAAVGAPADFAADVEDSLPRPSCPFPCTLLEQIAGLLLLFRALCCNTILKAARLTSAAAMHAQVVNSATLDIDIMSGCIQSVCTPSSLKGHSLVSDKTLAHRRSRHVYAEVRVSSAGACPRPPLRVASTGSCACAAAADKSAVDTYLHALIAAT